VAFVFEYGELRFYVNGNLDKVFHASSYLKPNGTPDVKVYIGGIESNPNKIVWPGYLDNLKIIDKAVYS
jgi:hypothetical protein